MTRRADRSAGVSTPAVAAPHVLVVDDDPVLLQAFQRALRFSCEVVAVHSVEAALTTLAAARHPFAAVVTDYAMRGLPGTELLTRARAIAPCALRILLTGDAGHAAVVDAVARTDAHHVLEKPFPPSALISLLQQQW